MNKRTVGQIRENLACEFLKSKGALILSRNFRCKAGEVDIIAKDDTYLCFIEVKYRSDDRFGQPQEAVDIKKQKRICNVSKFYLYSKYKSSDVPVRYDVIAISQKDDMLAFKWIKNAFDYV